MASRLLVTTWTLALQHMPSASGGHVSGPWGCSTLPYALCAEVAIGGCSPRLVCLMSRMACAAVPAALWSPRTCSQVGHLDLRATHCISCSSSDSRWVLQVALKSACEAWQRVP